MKFSWFLSKFPHVYLSYVTEYVLTLTLIIITPTREATYRLLFTFIAYTWLQVV